jgi:hypothetical protein
MNLLLLLACADETGVIEGNIPPTAVLLVPIDQGGLRQADTLTFSAFIADDSDLPSELEVIWSWAGEPLEGEQGLDGEIATVTVESPGLGDHEVWVEVVDQDGGTGGAEASFTLSLPENADLDGDGYLDMSLGGADCDDSDPDIGPGVEEICDGLDQNCDGQVDEGLVTTWSPDFDGDGYGDSTWEVQACERPNGHVVQQGGDCDDSDPTVFPGADEVCDGLDQDCDEAVDEGQGWFMDSDRDGFGDSQQPLASCDSSVGGSLDDTDCDDDDEGQRWCLSCADLSARGEVVEGINLLTTADGDDYGALCDGAWTLIATNTRGGDWNPANATDDTDFGTPSETTEFKSRAWSSAPFEDLRFVNDAGYAQYDGVGDGQLPWWQFQVTVPAGNCGVNTQYEWPLSEGTLAGPGLCSTSLYINVSSWYYGDSCYGSYPSFGPSWNVNSHYGCNLNLPHATGWLNDDLGYSPLGKNEGPIRMWVR